MEDLKVFKVCQQIVELTDNDISEAEAAINRQIGYISPLKPATQGRVNKAGRDNVEVLEALKALRLLIERGNPDNPTP